MFVDLDGQINTLISPFLLDTILIVHTSNLLQHSTKMLMMNHGESVISLSLISHIKIVVSLDQQIHVILTQKNAPKSLFTNSVTLLVELMKSMMFSTV